MNCVRDQAAARVSTTLILPPLTAQLDTHHQGLQLKSVAGILPGQTIGEGWAVHAQL